MAKRFTDTNKYKKPFVRSLPGAYKLLWDFLYHDCDNSGIWIVDFETAQIYVGKDMPIEERGALYLFNENEERIVVLDGGRKWFIPGFIEFQYGHLSQNNKAHAGPISALKKYDLLNTDLSLKIKIKEPTSPLQGAKYKVKEKDKDVDMDKDKEKYSETSVIENFLVPQMFKKFKKNIPTYPGSVDRDFKPLCSIANFLLQQGGLQGNLQDNSEEILTIWERGCQIISEDNFYRNKSLSTISNHIQEIVQIGINGKSNSKTGSKAVSASSAFRKIDRMSG